MRDEERRKWREEDRRKRKEAEKLKKAEKAPEKDKDQPKDEQPRIKVQLTNKICIIYIARMDFPYQLFGLFY